MNISRRKLALLGITLAGAFATAASLPARASDASDAADLVMKSQATITTFGASKEFPTFSPALAKARAVLIFPQIHDLPLMGLDELKETLPDVAEKLGPGDTWNDEAEKAFFESQLSR